MPCPYEGGPPVCPQPPRVQHRLLAGRNISQTLVSLDLTAGAVTSCAWVLLGSSPTNFTRWSGHPELACVRCQLTGAQRRRPGPDDQCSGPLQPRRGEDSQATAVAGCEVRLGPDCRFYSTQPGAPELECPAAVPAASASAGRPAAAAAAAAASSNVGGNSASKSCGSASALLLLSLLLLVRCL